MNPAASYFLEDKSQPLVQNNPSALLNDQLLTQYIDVAEDDYSCHAQIVRSVATFAGSIFRPRHVLAMLRILKTTSLCFIVLTILANAMYITFVEVFASKEVQELAGGSRDTLIRLFALMMSLIALAIELDYTKVVKLFLGLKAFIPRALLYLFISISTSSHPASEMNQQKNNYNANGNNGDDDANQNDDAYQQQDDYFYDLGSTEIPSSAVAFQMVASFVLGCCALGYLFCGILCFDRFTALAFISTKDPRVTTAIPSSTMENGNSLRQDHPSGMSGGLYA